MRVLAVINRHPLVTLLLLAAITAVAGTLAGRVTFQNAIEVWFTEGDPALLAYDEFTAHFAADETIVLAFETDVFTDEAYAVIGRLAQQASEAPYVHRVISVLDFDLDPISEFDVDEAESSPDWLFRQQSAAQNRLITPTFVSADGHSAGLVIEVARSGNTVEGKRALVSALDEIIDREATRSGVEVFMTGTPVLDQRALAYNDHDISSVYPFIVPLIFVICWLVFGSALLALIPLLVVAAAAAWAFCVMVLLGWQATLLTSAMLPLFLAIGAADTIHVLADFRRRRRLDVPVPEAADAAARRLWKPCLFTSLTTAAGLMALLVSSLQPVREFGLIAAIGVLAAFVLSMTLVPALLRLIGSGVSHDPQPLPSRVDAQLARCVAFLSDPPRIVLRLVIPVGLVLGLLGAASATRLEVGVDPVSWFREDDPFRVATEYVDRTLGGGSAIEFLVRAPNAGLRQPDNLRRIDEFERWIETSTLATVCISGVELVKEATRISSEAGYRKPRLPHTAILVHAMLDRLAARGELDRWITSDFNTGRISCRTPLGRVANLGGQLELINREVEARFASVELRIETTGYGALMVQMQHHLVRSQVQTVTIAFIVVFLMLAALIRSARIAAVAMLPNLVPVAVGLGLMPLLGISLNPGSVMVAAVALGIIVDDTAHLLVAMRRQFDHTSHATEALRCAAAEVGAPIILTSLVIIGSMAVLTFGSFAPGVHFGIIAITIVTFALLADLLLLPRLLCIAHARRRLFWRTARTQETET